MEESELATNEKGYAIDLAMKGKKLSTEEAIIFEKNIECGNETSDVHVTLLGYYDNERYKENKSNWVRHLVWLIKNDPKNAILRVNRWALVSKSLTPNHYNHAQSAWFESLKKDPTNTTLITHAIIFLEADEPELAKEIYASVTSSQQRAAIAREINSVFE